MKHVFTNREKILLVILAIDLVVEGIRALGRNKKAAQAAK